MREILGLSLGKSLISYQSKVRFLQSLLELSGLLINQREVATAAQSQQTLYLLYDYYNTFYLKLYIKP